MAKPPRGPIASCKYIGFQAPEHNSLELTLRPDIAACPELVELLACMVLAALPWLTLRSLDDGEPRFQLDHTRYLEDSRRRDAIRQLGSLRPDSLVELLKQLPVNPIEQITAEPATMLVRIALSLPVQHEVLKRITGYVNRHYAEATGQTAQAEQPIRRGIIDSLPVYDDHVITLFVPRFDALEYDILERLIREALRFNLETFAPPPPAKKQLVVSTTGTTDTAA